MAKKIGKKYDKLGNSNNQGSEKIAAIYIRVSTDYQAEEGYSIDAQKEQLTAWCVAKGIKNYDYYIDGGFSGSNLDRPEITRLINDAKEGKLSHCIVYKLDRLSRSQKDTLYLIEDVLNVYDVAFVSLNESLDTATPMGRLMIGILSAFAQLERENIFLRTRMGMTERVKKGYWPGGGRIPFGYDYDEGLGILVPNQNADKVRQMYKLYLEGYSCQSIANMLGLKYERLTTQVLKRKSNYGVIEYNGEIYQGLHEPLISKELYDETMQEMKRRSSLKAVTPSEHLLTSLVYCGKCGAKMRYQKWGKRNKLICYSQQPSKPYLVKDKDCNQEKLWAEDVEDQVLDYIFQLNEIYNENDEYLNDNQSNYREVENISILNVLMQQKEDLNRKIKRLYNLYAEAQDDVLLETINDNKKKLESVEIELQKNKELLEDAKYKNKVVNTLKSLDEIWDDCEIQEQKMILNALINKVVITNEDVEIIFNM